MGTKRVSAVYSAPEQHWVGDGFPVRSLFSYSTHGEELSPFLLLDYAGPMRFEPTDTPRGVGEHPHRGFETVTIVYQGEVAHRDSTGAGGTIGPGDVQWMTAASGILHDEFHSAEFTRNGGTLEIVQLWVNLPAKNKMAGPQYQDILNSDIPEIRLPAEAGTVRVIAGDYQGTRGAATTFTPIDLWDVRLNAGHSVNFEFREGRAVAMVVLHGSVSVEGDAVNEGQWVLLGETGQDVSVGVTKQTTLLLLSGERIDEPIAGYGPFVMNTAQEIKQAILDFNEGKFGHLQGHTPSMR